MGRKEEDTPVGVRLRPPLAGLAWIHTLTRPGARAELAITVSHEHSRCIFSPGSRHFNERQVPDSVGLKSSSSSPDCMMAHDTLTVLNE